MSAIRGEIFAIPYQTVIAAQHAVRPVVGSPRHPGRDHRSQRRVVIQISVAVELILNRPLHREANFVSVGFRIIRTSHAVGVSAIHSRPEKHHLQVREQREHGLHHGLVLGLQIGDVGGESSGRDSIRIFNEGGDDLVRGHTILRQVIVECRGPIR